MKFVFKMLGIALVALAAAVLILMIQYKGLRRDIADYKRRHGVL